MRPFLWCGEWLITSAQHIEIEGFYPLRRQGKRRRFDPFLVVNVGGHRLLFDGKEAVFAFVDALVPGLNRDALNAGMRGDFIIDGEQSFADDLRDFVREATPGRFVFTLKRATGYTEPNRSFPFDGHVCAEVSENATPRRTFSAPSAWGEAQSLMLPMRFAHPHVDWLPAIIVGDHPRRVAVVNLRRGWFFDADCISLVASCIYAGPHYADVRPHKTKRVESRHVLWAEVTQRVHYMHESGFLSPMVAEQDTPGMLYHEVDDVQVGRWNRHFFSTEEGIANQITAIGKA